MKAQITEVYSSYNFDHKINDPKENQKGYAVVECRWTEVIYKDGKWIIIHKPK